MAEPREPCDDVELAECSICRGTENLVRRPCLCKGSLGSVHVRCLEEWLTASCSDRCELCCHRFELVRIRRQSFIRSMPRHLPLLGEAIGCLLLLVLWLLLFLVSLRNMGEIVVKLVKLAKQHELERFWNPPPQDSAEGVMIRSKRKEAIMYVMLIVMYLLLITVLFLRLKEGFKNAHEYFKRKFRQWWNETSEVVLVLDKGGGDHVQVDLSTAVNEGGDTPRLGCNRSGADPATSVGDAAIF